MADRKATPYHHGNLRQALVQSALELLEQDGLEALSLRGVARAVGVSRAAPYSHFRDRRGLLAAVAAHGFRQLQARLRASTKPSAGPADRLARVGEAYVAFAMEQPALYRLMFSAELGGADASEELKAAGDAAYGELDAALGASADEPSRSPSQAQAVRTAAWSLVHGLALLLLDHRLNVPAADQAEFVQTTTRLFADRLCESP